MSAVDIALSLAAVGWHVFPCTAEGKPLVRWGDEATTDPATIKRGFRRGERIGIHCGKSGLLVVDRDRKDDRDGFASLKAAGIKLPATMHYTSRSGRGRHDLYAAPAGMDCTIATDVHGMAGVDIRAGVGMVIYNGPALTEAPSLAPAPAWAIVHRKERGYSSTVSLEAWLAEERTPEPNTKARTLAEAVPLDGVSNAKLLPLLTPIVDALVWGQGRRQAYDVARERYTRNYPDAGEAFDQAWIKAVARVEADWQAVMHAPPTERIAPTRAEARPRARTLQLTPASAIRPRPVVWLWDGRLALGTLALLAGREGIGKSTTAYWIAARVTRGELPGESLGKPRGVLIAATEDSWEHTIVPRLIAAKADLDRVFRVEVRTAEDIHVGLSLPHDIHALEQAAQQTDAGLLLLDPLMSRLGEQDTHKDSDVRIALEPLVAVADTTGMAVLGIMHHNKSGSTDPLQLVMGSKAFTAVARSVHTVVIDPDDDTEQRKLFGTPKNNLGRTDLPTLTFTIASTGVRTAEGTAWTGRVVWGEDLHESIGSVMGRTGTETDRSATTEAAEWLQDVLSEGIMASSAVKERAKRVAISVDALKRACKRLDVIVTSAGYPRRTYWDLPVGAQSAQPLRGEQLTTPTTPTSTRLGMSEATVGAVGAVGAVGGAPRARKPTRAAGGQKRKPRVGRTP
ncbi:AAA family ATPase [Agrococcus sp. ProA11]|uniref:AAA family ATPase n=1 Tax=Agrococcus chionoecetis TaxID=3153752 RepID=UPI00326173A3